MARWPAMLALFSLIALTMSSVALADFGRVYKWQFWATAHTAWSDNVYHNHTYNDIYFGAGANYPSALFEVTPQGAIHYEKHGFGNIFNSHAGVYYDAPFCMNDDGVGHYIDCSAAWG